MITKVREFQKKLPDRIIRLRDKRTKVDQDFSEFLLALKRCLPQDEEPKPIRTLQDFEDCAQKMDKIGTANMAIMKEYMEFLDISRKALRSLRSQTLYRLQQVSKKCESPAQRRLKSQMNEMCILAQKRLQRDFDLTTIPRHQEWQGKLTQKEEVLFLGLLNLLSHSVDAITDFDQLTDEYLSGFVDK